MPQIFPGFDSFPQKAKWGTLDLIYNLGIVNFRGAFRRFQAAVKDRNWQLAAAESKRTEKDMRSGEISQGVANRNDIIRRWFRQARDAEPFFLKSYPRPCQTRWHDLRNQR